MLPKSLQRLAIAEREGNRASHGTHRALHSRVRCAAVMAAEPGRSGRRRRRGSRGFPPPAQTPPRTATAPAGDGTACPAGTHRVSAVSSPRTASPDAPAILMSPRAWVRSLISFPGTTAIASGEQAGSGSARRTFSQSPSTDPAQGSWRWQLRQSSPSAREHALACTLLPTWPASARMRYTPSRST